MTRGERIKFLREKNNMTQTELAEKIKTTKQNVYKYESGIITNIPSDKIEKMADLFGVSPSYVMGWSDTFTNCSEKENDEFHLFATEKDMIQKFRCLTDKHQSNVIERINVLYDEDNEAKQIIALSKKVSSV